MFEILKKGSNNIVIEGMGVPEQVQGISDTYGSMNRDIVDYKQKSSELYAKQEDILETPNKQDRNLEDIKTYIQREKSVLIIGGVSVSALIIATVMLYLKD